MAVSYLKNIQDALVSAIEGIDSDATTQQEDFVKVSSWPLYNVYLLPEEKSNDSISRTNMNSFENEAMFEIRGFDKLNNQSTNSVFEIDSVLNRMLRDMKLMIGSNPYLSNLVQEFTYTKSERRDSGQSEDILLPKYLAVRVNVRYSQDRTNPILPAY